MATWTYVCLQNHKRHYHHVKYVRNTNRLMEKQYIHEESCSKIYYKDLNYLFPPIQQSRNEQDRTLREDKSGMQPTG